MTYFSPALSVIVATYNRPNTLLRLLGILNDQRCIDLRGVDVCVVDDGSPYGDNYFEFAPQDYRFRFKYIFRARSADNTSHVYSSRNIAARETSGNFILQLDDDVEFHPYLLNMLQTMAGMVQEEHWLWTPRISDNKDVDPSGYTDFHRWKDGKWYDGKTCWVETHWGCTDSSGMFMPRVTWEAVEGYDEEYDGAMGESDQDLAIRVQKLGKRPGDVKVYIAPYFVHKADEETGSWRDRMISGRVRPESNGEMFARKHPDRTLWTNV